MGQADSVVVLGLGRMGAAMARRYADTGRSVTSWSRSGRGSAETAAEATRAGDPVVLALYDGVACQAVLGGVSGALGDGQLVVNTSTIAPDDAARLADLVVGAGARYVHAPVLGSVPAVLSGSLRVLAGGNVTDVGAAADVLAPLATEVRHVGDPRAAAAAKLVANASLAGSALALRDALEGAALLGLPLADALDILELGRLGDLVRGSRERLEAGHAGEAFFTAGAIAKDSRLVADATGSAAIADRLQALLASGEVDVDDDFTLLALPPIYRTTAAR